MLPGEFSHFRVLSRLGEGGMGEVFLAEDLSLNRKVALKFLFAEDQGRLIREARAVAHLDHPFICKVYEVGEHDGRPFFAMEYVDGVTLKDRLTGGPLPRKDAIRIAGEIADALHFAHTRSIVHRDLKPANVMLGADGHVKVMDFGIAKRLAAPVAAEAVTMGVATVSLPGAMTGTLAYMSPEQLRGDAIDQRSDVFAFGLLLHELLSGTHPFLRASGVETANAILNDPTPALDQTVTGGSQLLSHIAARCLEKDRDRRYQSLGDVRIELDGLTGPAPPAAAPTVKRRNKPAWIAAAALGGMLALGAVHTVWPLPFLTPEPVLAFKERDWIVVADFNNLTNDPVFDSSLRLALQVALAQSQYVNVYPQDRVAGTLRRMQRKPAGAPGRGAGRRGRAARQRPRRARVRHRAARQPLLHHRARGRSADQGGRAHRFGHRQRQGRGARCAGSTRETRAQQPRRIDRPHVGAEPAAPAGHDVVARGAEALHGFPEARSRQRRQREHAAAAGGGEGRSGIRHRACRARAPLLHRIASKGGASWRRDTTRSRSASPIA